MSKQSERASDFLKKEVGEVPKHAVVLEKYDSAVSDALQTMRTKILSDGKLSKKAKELIRIGIAASIRLPKDPFARLHAFAAVKSGATPEEIHEAVEVALLFCGLSGYAEYGYAVVQEAENISKSA